MDAAIILTRGAGHTKVNCHANYDMFAVLIPFQIFIPSAVQGFSKMEEEKAKNVLFHDPLLLFCTQL